MTSHERALAPDPEHERFLAMPIDRAAWLTGAAGTGKTTLALRRLAAHRRADPDVHAVVIVPVDGLVAPIERLCARLGAGAEVTTFDRWVTREAHRVFPRIPRRRSQDTPAASVAFRRHPAVRAVLDDVVVRGDTVRAGHLFELWGDDRLLAAIVDASDGALDPAMAAATRDHAAIQHAARDRDDDGRLIRSFGVPLTDGTPLHDAESLAAEDLPVLFALRAIATGGRPAVREIDHLVIDEAQELAPLELALLGTAALGGAALTVAGDDRQRLDPTAWFDGWPASLRELGRRFEPFALTRGYRSHPEIAAVSDALRRGDAVPPPSDRVGWWVWPDRDARDRAVLDAVDAGAASTAVVAATRAEAARLRDLLRGRRVVCAIPADLRGQEFDRVVVADADAYGDPDRDALYVAVSRARHQLQLHAVAGMSPLLATPRSAPGSTPAPATRPATPVADDRTGRSSDPTG
ncbi:MAG: AAA family ATPase [Myxococcota bacterium]